MTPIGWAAISAWLVCWVVTWRPAFRYFCSEIEPSEWLFLASNLFFATFFSCLCGPVIALWQAFMATVGRGSGPLDVAGRLAGEPRKERLGRRLRELEQRNAELERELAL